MLQKKRHYFFFVDLTTPCFTATDLSAIVLPPDEWPFRISLLASVSSFLVGGLMVSFFVAIEFSL